MTRSFDKVCGSVQTTDATITTLITYAVPDNSVLGIDLNVLCKSGADVKRFSTRSVFKRTGGGAVAEAGTPLEPVVSQGNAGLAAAVILLEANGNNVRARVTGIALTSIDWDCLAEIYIFTP